MPEKKADKTAGKEATAGEKPATEPGVLIRTPDGAEYVVPDEATAKELYPDAEIVGPEPITPTDTVDDAAPPPPAAEAKDDA